jgi:transcription elongation GreA/GreB family factor
MTPSGLQQLKDEHRFLLTRERPAVTRVVAWAASNTIAATTPTIITASGGCTRSIGGFAFSRNESMPRK